MSEAAFDTSETIDGESFEPGASAPEGSVSESAEHADPAAGAVATRMVGAFLAILCRTLGRIAPAETTYRVTYGPGVTPRVTLHALDAKATSDARAWYHIAAGRSSSARREGYLRACLAKTALLLAIGDEKGAKMAMGVHGAESPEGPKPEQWARALEKASGPIAEAYAALVTAQGDYAFPFGSRPVKSGKLAHRWYAFYTNADGKEAKIAVPASWVPDPKAYDPDHDGESSGADADPTADEGTEIPTTMVLLGIEHPVILKRVMVRK